MATKESTQSFDPMQILFSALSGNKGATKTTSTSLPQQALDTLAAASKSAGGVSSAAAEDDIIQRALQAFAPVINAQRGAGGYNTASTKLLAGNAAAEAAKQALIARNQSALDQAKTQAGIAQLMSAGGRTTETSQGAAVDPGKALLMAAGSSILGGIGKKAAEKGGSVLSGLGDKAWDAGADWINSMLASDTPATGLDLGSSYADIGASLNTGETMLPDFMSQAADISTGLGDLVQDFDISSALDTGVSTVQDAFDWLSY